METSTISVKFLNLRDYWVKGGDMPRGWCPQLYHCGVYDPSLDGFPVLRSHHHIIYIPALSKPIFRFLQHAMYCLWYLSLSERFTPKTQANFWQASAYLHLLREGFFEEGQAIPTSNKMTRQWFSSVLFSWGLVMFHSGKISPPDSTWLLPTNENGQPLPTKFDWDGWSNSSKIDLVTRSLYGSFPDTQDLIDRALIAREASESRNDPGPMVETDEESWRCTYQADRDLEAAAKAVASTAAMEVNTQHSVGGSGKRPSSSAPDDSPENKKAKKAKVTQSHHWMQPIPQGAGSKPPTDRIPRRDKGKGKEKGQALESGAQFSSSDASGSAARPSSSRVMEGWTPEERFADIGLLERQGDDSWTGFIARMPTRPSGQPASKLLSPPN
ncbi:hypothetical protein BDR07DRAFT_1383382 [Suillus spraguei]|nr:hypothetical protein BDR07DRAFT_1383382 [Suillus spraguei]